ncbi:hypothetical protein [Pseudoalteromonas luteoviolacea]|uniref:Uncharacterized protein n=1 Tax=Pseudoalteromonas luteoviolacea S4054 TaxID=1129367 RepID=A0A0F6A5C1_9GAMM|nr:hypothetical protein [Pseudoalteromonas luteoviolacea]AOT07637.1 hypothetical protein S4054249_07185 [Pseudoalteromonas luteoviolacea]AOT12553.1 hypothetical protein S40542_07185 [Pseudoalteromonas luteoviolacea]AOT17467.1 hypothetical protein S4054_07185 [Pseudoalteromonas luteoviolacea]KKE81380.1 hypothetical protein N479_22870 [Pseudoalteromonas luteoviolacea S4054]KZN70611.1 hypothetical protein N481_20560 [Pseudoalteromonas luteoviolacea S4047-1]
MLKPVSHVLIIVAVLVAFIGQSLAYNFVMSFEQGLTLVADSDSQQILEGGTQNEDDCCEVDCCEDECICPSNACMTFAYVKPDNHSVSFSKYHHMLFNISREHPIKVQDSLFRPPIFAS